MSETLAEPTTKSDYIRDAIRQDLEEGRYQSVHTRFPPEPNAYLHIGHAKAIWINYGIAQDFGGLFNLRFDDTNPEKEEQEFVDGIIEDVRWLGADWGDRLFFASDYFEQMVDWAVDLIKKGKAFVCDLTAEEMRLTRGTLSEPGQNSPYRGRTVEENLDLFSRMRAGEFPDGSKTLRAKIDMASPNIVLRDPVMYRIRHVPHHRQGAKWCLYPSYDWAHGLEDSIEGVTHSLCSLEYEIHRPLYDWFLEALDIYRPRQIEFPRLNLTYTVMSKRRFVELVKGGYVSGYDDPRMPTVVAMRRRGYTPEAIREFIRRVGLTKADSVIEAHVLEDCVREDLNKHAQRVMAVLNPLKVTITNYPEGQSETLDAVNNPEDPEAGKRQVPFGRELWIEREDFMEEPPPKFFRLAPGREVRLRYAYFIKCEEVVKDANGEVIELKCTYDPATRGGDAPDGRKVKATLHWVAAHSAIEAEARLYDHLFLKPNPDDVGGIRENGESGGKGEIGENCESGGSGGKVEIRESGENGGKGEIRENCESGENGGKGENGENGASGSEPFSQHSPLSPLSRISPPPRPQGSYLSNLNPNSLKVVTCFVEPSVVGATPGTRYQFERMGYFCVDKDSAEERLVFNRTATLRDTWASIQKAGG